METGKGLVHMKIIRSIFSITDMKKKLYRHMEDVRFACEEGRPAET